MKNDTKKKVYSLVFTGLLGVAVLNGCAKTVDCNIKDNHAHKYVNKSGIVCYIDSEKTSKNGFDRLDEYISLDKEEEKLRAFENKKGLYRIEENGKYIDSLESTLEDYIEYEYEDTYTQYIMSGDVIVPVIMTNYYWTTDPNHYSLTGRKRKVHHVYNCYNIVKDEDNKLVIVSSDSVDSIEDLKGEYKYINKIPYSKQYSYSK